MPLSLYIALDPRISGRRKSGTVCYIVARVLKSSSGDDTYERVFCFQRIPRCYGPSHEPIMNSAILRTADNLVEIAVFVQFLGRLQRLSAQTGFPLLKKLELQLNKSWTEWPYDDPGLHINASCIEVVRLCAVGVKQTVAPGMIMQLNRVVGMSSPCRLELHGVIVLDDTRPANLWVCFDDPASSDTIVLETEPRTKYGELGCYMNDMFGEYITDHRYEYE